MDSPIRGRTRELTHKVEAIVPMNIHNRFDVEVIDSRTGKIRQRAQAENVICSQLWTRLLTPNTYFNYIHYGTGSGTPAAINTSLFTFLGYGTPAASDDVYTTDLVNGVLSLRRKIVLSETTAVGSTLTEVGIGYSSSASTLCTHAMLKDANGNQISIAKTNTDIVNIFATVFVHYAVSGFDNSSIKAYVVDANYYSNTVGFKMWLLGLGYSPFNSLCVRYGRNIITPSTGYYFSASLTTAYNVTSKTATLTMSRITSDNGNSGGIFAVSLNTDEITAYAGEGGSWFNTSQITGESIGTGDGSIKDFSTAFRFISGVKLYIDGVETTNFTYDSNKPATISDVGKFFKLIGHNNLGTSNPDVCGLASSTAANAYAIYENTMNDIGIYSFYTNRSTSDMKIELSDDLSTWTTISQSSTTILSSDLRKKRYWKLTQLTSNPAFIKYVTLDTPNASNLHFTSAPASGAVITADYTTACIAKDANHVFDMTMTIQLGEYTA